jgi:hypothetical protein
VNPPVNPTRIITITLHPWLQVAEALKERSQRIYDKYGTLMLNTEGMTADGLERKATCRWVGLGAAKREGGGLTAECMP